MGLRQCFEAADVLPFEELGDEPLEFGATYNDYLLVPPRIYAVEPVSYTDVRRLGIVWSQANSNPYASTSINVLSVLNTYRYPGWAVRLWRIDGKTGNYLSQLDGAGSDGVSFDGLSWETSGFLWEFSGHPFYDDNGAVRLDGTTLEVNPASVLSPSAFVGHETDEMVDFAIDRRPGSDRVFIRWNSDFDCVVRAYAYSTKALVATLYATGETVNVVVTNDGFVYIADVNDWLSIYDFDGKYFGSIRHPRQADYPGGFCWGWDSFYKRLLFLGGTAHEVDGASTLTVQGFYPEPEAIILTDAIPRHVPRKGRTVYSFAHLCGAGGEPLSGRRVTASGDASGSFSTDNAGDIAVPTTPAAAGTIDIDLEVP